MNKEFEKLCGEITEKLDNTAEYESWLIVQDYIDELKQALNEIRDKIKNNQRYEHTIFSYDCEEETDILDGLYQSTVEDILQIIDKVLGGNDGNNKDL